MEKLQRLSKVTQKSGDSGSDRGPQRLGSETAHSAFPLRALETHRTTESKRRASGRPPALLVFQPPRCACEGWAHASLDGPPWLGLKATSLQFFRDRLALAFFLSTASRSSNESAPVIFPSLYFNLVIPSFFYFFIYD
ncbi:unnamed protein product [Rangifer tarandus platyrhynchus]|uniref:Transmembrane protein n=1 Tax=Rangifer tarandus platyrhynchus TaxID=3082113 RepID=A0ABN8YC72_RANTA|nr:unnamed protein product [Rangifer tarandus platyrhynchus]